MMPPRKASAALLLAVLLLAPSVGAIRLDDFPTLRTATLSTSNGSDYAVTANDTVAAPFLKDARTQLHIAITRGDAGLTHVTVASPPGWRIDSGEVNAAPMRADGAGSMTEGYAMRSDASGQVNVTLQVSALRDLPEGVYRFNVTVCSVATPGRCNADAPANLTVDGTPPRAPLLTLRDPLSPTAGWSQGNVTLLLADVANDITAWNATESPTLPSDAVWGKDTTYRFSPEERTHTLYLYVRDLVGNVNATNASIRVDRAAPVTSIATGSPASSWQNTSPIVTFGAEDGANGSGVDATGTVWSWPGQNGSGAQTPHLRGEGSLTLSYHSTDRAGRVEDVHTATYRVDLTRPTLDVTPIATTWLPKPPLVEVRVTDDLSGVSTSEYRITAGAFILKDWTPYTRAFALDANSSDVHVLFASSDRAGNTNGTRLAPLDLYGALRIDQRPPVVTNSTSPSDPDGARGWFVTRPTVTLGATDDVSSANITSWDVLSSGRRLSHGTSTRVTLPDGANITLNATATDAAGNTANSTMGPFAIDATPPTLAGSLSPPLPASGWYGAPPTLTLNASDATSGIDTVSFRVFTGGVLAQDWTPYTGPTTIPVAGRNVTIEAAARDNASNPTSLTFDNTHIDLDTPRVTPQLAPSEPNGANTWYVTRPTLAFDITDNTSNTTLALTLDGANTTYAGPLVIEAGDHDVTYTATDEAEHASPLTHLRVRVDDTPPVTTPTGTRPGTDWTNTLPRFHLTATDTMSGVDSILVDDERFAGGDHDVTLPEGASSRVTYRAVDIAGNLENETTLGPYKVDITPPVISASGPAPTEGWLRVAPHLSTGATDALSGVATCTYDIAGSLADRAQSPCGELDLTTEGTQVMLVVHATDRATNAANATLGPYRVDLTPPRIQGVVAPTQNGWYTSAPRVSLSATDPLSGLASCTYRVLDHGTMSFAGSCDTPFDLTTQSNDITILVTALDVAGNAANATLGPFLVDLTPPSVNATVEADAGQNGWLLTSASVTLSASDATSGIARVETSTDGGAHWTNVSGVLRVEDSTLLSYRAMDVAGNLAPTRTIDLHIDPMLPQANCAIAGQRDASGAYVGAVDITMDAMAGPSGIDSFTFSFDGGPVTAVPATFHTSRPGDHRLDVTVTSGSGRVAGASCAFTIAALPSVPPPAPPPPAPVTRQAVAPNITVSQEGVRAGNRTIALDASANISVDGGRLQVIQGGIFAPAADWADDIIIAWSLPSGSTAERLLIIGSAPTIAIPLTADQTSARVSLAPDETARVALVLVDQANAVTTVRILPVHAPQGARLNVTDAQANGAQLSARFEISPATATLQATLLGPGGQSVTPTLTGGVARATVTAPGVWTVQASLLRGTRIVATATATIEVQAGRPDIEVTPLAQPDAEGRYAIPLDLRVDATDTFGSVPVTATCVPLCLTGPTDGILRVEAGGTVEVHAHASGPGGASDIIRFYHVRPIETLRPLENVTATPIVGGGNETTGEPLTPESTNLSRESAPTTTTPSRQATPGPTTAAILGALVGVAIVLAGRRRR